MQTAILFSVKKKHYIQTLIEQGEHLKLDFKFEIAEAPKIARSLVAFANTEGGKLLVGVKDNGVIKGVQSNEEYYMLEHAAQSFCKPEVAFRSKEWIVEGKKVLEVSIDKSSDRPHKAPDNKRNFKAYIRVADENVLANGVQMKVWKRLNDNSNINLIYSETESLLLKYLKTNGHISIATFCKLADISKYRAEQLLADLIVMEVIDMRIVEKSASFHLKEE